MKLRDDRSGRIVVFFTSYIFPPVTISKVTIAFKSTRKKHCILRYLEDLNLPVKDERSPIWITNKPENIKLAVSVKIMLSFHIRYKWLYIHQMPLFFFYLKKNICENLELIQVCMCQQNAHILWVEF